MRDNERAIQERERVSRNGTASRDRRRDRRPELAVCQPSGRVPFSNFAGDVPLPIDDICDSLLMLTGGWPKCISGVICYRDNHEVRVLKNASALFAWIGSHATVEWK